LVATTCEQIGRERPITARPSDEIVRVAKGR
jgi:hypothetical protein